MYERDLVVAAVAVGLGCAMIRGMWINSEWCFRLNSAATLEQSFGRTGARWIIGAIGVALIWVGGQLVVAPYLSDETMEEVAGGANRVTGADPLVSWSE